MLTSLEVNY